MKLWIRRNRDVVFKVTLGGGYALIKGYDLLSTNKNKRLKIKEVDIISFASSLSYNYPSDFISIYYSEDIRYWHELRKLIKVVCY